MKKGRYIIKFMSVLLALCCALSCISGFAAGETAEIANISVDENKVISWKIQNGDYSGANIYRLDKNNSLVLAGTTKRYYYTCSENGNYVVRAYSDFGESKGKIITVSDDKPFEIYLDNIFVNNGSVLCEVRVKNTSAQTVSGVAAVQVFSVEGEINKYVYNRLTLGAQSESAFRASFKVGEYAKTIKISVLDSTVSKKLYSNEIVKDYGELSGNDQVIELADSLHSKAQILENLINECETKGISTDYEKINYSIVKRFADYVEEDLANNDLDRIEYTGRTTNRLYEEAKVKLEAYLAGEEEPLTVPHYVTSDVRIDGEAMYAMTDNNGTREERPVFFVGYLGYDQAKADIPVFNQFGVNSIQQETGPSLLMSNGSNWTMKYHSSPVADYCISDDAPESGARSLKITYDSELTANQFFSVTQSVKVEPGKTYVLKGKVKSENAESFAVSANNYDNRVVFSGTSGWKDFSTEYTAPAGKTSTIIRILVDAPADAVYFSKLSFKEKSGGDAAQELLKDGDFTKYGSLELEFDPESENMNKIKKMLKDAEDNNIAVSFLVSPHYFFDDIIKQHGLEHNGEGAFLKYNVNDPIAKQIVEQYLRTLIPIIKDYKCINNICISNEPSFNSSLLQEFYSDEWQEWLSEQYNGDISALNEIYGKSYESFADVKMEYEIDNTAMDAPTYDYMRFNSKVFGEWHKFIADIIHELAPGIPVNSKILGWTSSSRYPEGFLNGTNLEEYYSFMDLNGCDYNNFINDNRGHLTKEMWYDYMLSFKEVPVVDTEDHIIKDNSADLYTDEVADYFGQVIYQGAIHGRAMSDIWVWERSMINTALRDSILYRPDAIAEVGYAANDLNRLSYEITAIQNEPAEVGILFSNSELLLNSDMSMHALYEAYEAVMFNGQKARFILDIKPEDMHKYKLIIIPNSAYIKDETLIELNKYVENGGKVFIMEAYNPYGTFGLDEHGARRTEDSQVECVRNILSHADSVRYGGTYYEMLSMTKQELCARVRDNLKEAGAYYVSVVNADTNEPAHNIEYNLGVCDNKVIVNLSNFGEAQNIKIFVGDTPVTESTELRRNKAEGEVISIGKFEVKTIRTNVEGGFRPTE
ncbi:MAG: beta-galactosidase [Monoglobaceae bacterium]